MGSPKLVFILSSARGLPSVRIRLPHVGVGRGVRGPGGQQGKGARISAVLPLGPGRFSSLRIGSQASRLGAIERPTQSGERTCSPAEWIQTARRCSEAGPPRLPTVAGCVRLSVEVRTQNRCPPLKARAPPPRPGCWGCRAERPPGVTLRQSLKPGILRGLYPDHLRSRRSLRPQAGPPSIDSVPAPQTPCLAPLGPEKGCSMK